MTDQKFVIQIDRPIEDVFAFISNPAHTPEWIRTIVKEEASGNSTQTGSIIRNWDEEGRMNEYKVTVYDKPKLLQLESTIQDYKLRYTCTSISYTQTELEYHEWSESGQLHSSSMQEVLGELKAVMEWK